MSAESAEKEIETGISTLQHAADYIFSQHVLRPAGNQIVANQEHWHALLMLQQSRQSLQQQLVSRRNPAKRPW
jgi:hypothetical protein